MNNINTIIGRIWSIIYDNKEWLFSGAGLLIVTILFNRFYKDKTKNTNSLSIKKQGDYATNIQKVNSVNIGLSYSEVHTICSDLIKDNLIKFTQIAEGVAKKRDEELFYSFLKKLYEAQLQEKDVLQAFANPDMQYAYIEARKGYIRKGTPELVEILSSLLVDRAKETGYSLLQIALSEAIKVVPLLLKPHFNILALTFILTYAQNSDINDFNALKAYLRRVIVPLMQTLETKESYFQHLEYVSCANISVASLSLADIFKERYTGLFVLGFDKDDMPKNADGKYLDSLYPELFKPCINDNNKKQLRLMRKSDLEQVLRANTKYKKDEGIIRELFNKKVMNSFEIQNKIIGLEPKMRELFQYWDTTSIESLTLTSVGMIIGAAYVKQVTHEKIDLSIWI